MFYRINDKMFNENLATLKSPDRQAKCMRIQFEIKEKLPNIISEILHSDKWLTLSGFEQGYLQGTEACLC